MSKWRLAASCASWFTGYEEVVYCIMMVDGIWDLQQLARVQVVNDRIHIISSWRVAHSGLSQLMMLLCGGWWHMAFESTQQWQQQWLSGRCGHSILSWDRANVKMIDELHHHHNRFTALFPGPPAWASARRELLDFMVQGKTNRSRHTDHPAGRHSIWTNQCPPLPFPIFFMGRMPFLPPI